MISPRWRNSVTALRRKALFVAALASVVLAGAWWSGHSWHRQKLLAETRGEVLAQIDPYGNALSIDLARRFEVLGELKLFIETHRSPATLGADFELWARQRMENNSAIRNTTIAPAGVQRFVYPLAGNENILGHDLLHDSRSDVRADVARAIESRRIAISGPNELRQGDFGVVARLAVYRGKEFWGLATVTLDVSRVLEAVGITKKGKLQMALRDGASRVFFGAPAVFLSEPVIHPIQLPEGHWDLAAIPGNGWSGAIGRELEILDAGALSAVILLSVLMYIFAFRDVRLASAVASRTREIDSARRDLEKELTERKAVEFYAVGQLFKEFEQVSDEDVIKTLESRETQVSAVG